MQLLFVLKISIGSNIINLKKYAGRYEKKLIKSRYIIK